jgi:RimJ/RimL family protein N-acetyltransferase
MPEIFLQGQKAFLRPLQARDADGPWPSWLNDQSVTRYMTNGTWPVTREDQIEYVKSVSGSRSTMVLAICLAEDGRHVGNVSLASIDFINRRAELGILIGDSRCHGRGIGSEAIRLLSGHGFDRLNLHKIWARTDEANVAALKAFKKAGFEVEGLLKEENLHHGRWHSSHYLGLLESTYRAGLHGTAP